MKLDRLSALFAERMHGRVQVNISLAPYTTYRLGGPAALLVEAADDEDLRTVGKVLGEEGASIPVLPMGRGSNLVVSDRGFPGVVVRLGKAFADIGSWDPPPPAPEGSGLVAGAAASLPQLANWAARRGLAGLEWGVGVPGSVGGGVRMNAGAHERDVAGVLARILVWPIDEGTAKTVAVDQLDYGYRRSNLTERDLVVRAWFGLAPDDPESIKERTDRFRRHRALTQPGALQNAGSVFKNPEGDHAGRLVEAAGLKGFAIGGASVSELHANFFIAADGATAQDVFDLVVEIRERVRTRFGVDLEPEIRFVGAFEEHTTTTGEGR